VDNKAYKPPLSDSESELSDDGKTRRKKKKKGGPTGGPLSTLPVLLADKAKKKKKKTQRKNLETQEDESDSEEISQQMDIVCISIPNPKSTSEHISLAVITTNVNTSKFKSSCLPYFKFPHVPGTQLRGWRCLHGRRRARSSFYTRSG
jgi:hypothetical protein